MALSGSPRYRMTGTESCLLHSHGYTPSFLPFPNPAPSIDPTQPGYIPASVELLDLGYAVVASSYVDKGWALPTAPQDQLDSLQAAIAAIGSEPEMVLAYGTSMGGLVTAQIAESAGDVIDGAMPTCGIVAGGADLNNYQLDGAHAINQLLADGTIPIAGYGTQGEAFAASGALQAAVNAAATVDTPEARARVALAAAFFQLDPSDLEGILGFVTPARFDLITAAGGDSGWNEGVDYWKLFRQSPYRRVVSDLYRGSRTEPARGLGDTHRDCRRALQRSRCGVDAQSFAARRRPPDAGLLDPHHPRPAGPGRARGGVRRRCALRTQEPAVQTGLR